MIYYYLIYFFISFNIIICPSLALTSDDYEEYAVEMDMDKLQAELDLGDYNIEVLRKVQKLGNVFHLRRHLKKCDNKNSRCKRDVKSDEMESVLRKHPLIKRVELQYDLEVVQKEREDYEFSDRNWSRDQLERLNKVIMDDIDRGDENDMDKLVDIHKKNFNDNPQNEEIRNKNQDNSNNESANEDVKSSYKSSENDKEYLKSVKRRSELLSQITFNDPQARNLWQYNNDGQFGVNPGLDMNLHNVYYANYSGENVVVTIIDDGLDTKHVEIQPNFDPVASLDMNDPNNEQASPRGPKYRQNMPLIEGHGTSCGSLIAGTANNNFCGHGVAYKANIGGIRMLARNMVTDLLEAYALTHNNEYISIYSNSWGPKDNGAKTATITYYVRKALETGIKHGRKGLGSIFLFASGNGGLNYDNCGADGLVNSPYTISVTAVNIYGLKPAYTEECSAVTITAPVGGYSYDEVYGYNQIDPVLIAAQVNNKCLKRFLGTSAATPLISGCLALLLEANSDLSWRDIQHLLSLSARVPNNREAVWQQNSAGILVSHYYGFGMLDCSVLVRNGQIWRKVAHANICIAGNVTHTQNIHIRRGERTRVKFETRACSDLPNSIGQLEHVVLHTKINHLCRGDIAIVVTAPSGTKSFLLRHRKKDKHQGTIKFSFLSLMHWGENPKGTWIIDIADLGNCGVGEKSSIRGQILEMVLELHGTDKDNSPYSLNSQVFNSYLERAKIKLSYNNKSSNRILNQDQLDRAFQAQRQSYIQTRPLHKMSNNLLKDMINEQNKKNRKESSDILRKHFNDQVEKIRSKIPNDDVTFLQAYIKEM